MPYTTNAVRLLLCVFLLLHSSCEKRGSEIRAVPTPTQPSGSSQDLRSDLIASLRADMDELRAAKNSEKESIHHLAQALDQIIRLDTTTTQSIKNTQWNTIVLTNGSKKSIDLATTYLEQGKAHQLEVTKQFDKHAQDTVVRITDELLLAENPEDFDASLLEIATLVAQSPGSDDLRSTHLQLVLFHQLVTTWCELLTHTAAGQHSEAIQSLSKIESSASSIGWVNQAAVFQTAKSQLGIPSERQVDATVKSLLERAISATKPEDLDPLYVEIRELKAFEDVLPRSTRRRIHATETLTNIIQEGLLAMQSKNSTKLKEFVSRLESQETADLSIPRSRYLLYVHEVKRSILPSEHKPIIPATSPEDAVARMTTLSAISPNLPALRLAVESDRDHPHFGTWFLELSSLQRMASRSEQLLAGNGMQRAVHDASLKMTTIPAIRELQRQFDVLCLHITFAEETRLPPTALETARDYTARLRAKLAELGKWELLQTLYTASRAIKIMEPIMNKDDDNAVSGFLYGLRLANEAKDLRMATCALQTVLTNSSKLVPASLVGKHLEEIRKSDSQAYLQGSELALNISKAEGKRAPGERAESLQWVIPARKPWKN